MVDVSVEVAEELHELFFAHSTRKLVKQSRGCSFSFASPFQAVDTRLADKATHKVRI
ncbi:MAG TPA: hypothetical protein VIL92_13565 [Gaiellaceae bacterium]